MKRTLWLPLIVALALAPGCGKKRTKARAPAPPPRIGAQETGLASWYGHPYHGRAAASGEIYDMEKLTAAHRTLPFGTTVRVLNLSNDRTVEVRINDRGPFVGGRIIDLSKAAAREIQMLGPGTARVRLTIIAAKAPDDRGYYGVQTGAFRDRTNAVRQRALMAKQFGWARLIERGGDPPLWRVVVGREPTEEGATTLAGRISAENGPTFVVRVDGPQAN
jgi:rare lipoprotein A